MQHQRTPVRSGQASVQQPVSVASAPVSGPDGRNERFYALLVQSGESYNTFARKVGVDPKTVQRWVSVGRVPHPRIAYAAAEVLGVKATYVWPALGRRHQVGIAQVDATSELLGFYAGPSAVPFELWSGMLSDAQYGIDIMGDAGLADHVADVAGLLAGKAAEGVMVRVVLADPVHAATPAEAARCKAVARLYAPLIGRAGVIVARALCPVVNTMIRADGDMLLRTPIDGCPKSMAPFMHVRQIPGGSVVQIYRTSFDCMLECSEILTEASAPVRAVA